MCQYMDEGPAFFEIRVLQTFRWVKGGVNGGLRVTLSRIFYEGMRDPAWSCTGSCRNIPAGIRLWGKKLSPRRIGNLGQPTPV